MVILDRPTTTVDSTGIAKLSVSFPTTLKGRIDEIECHYRIEAPKISLGSSGIDFTEIIFDKILLNGIETQLRKLDPETGKIAKGFTNRLGGGTLVITPIEK